MSEFKAEERWKNFNEDGVSLNFKSSKEYSRSSRTEVFCNKVAGLMPETLLKRGSGTGIFL